MTIPKKNPFDGAIYLSCGMSVVEVWQYIHENAKAWNNAPIGRLQDSDRLSFDEADKKVLVTLDAYEAEKWIHLCNSAGWTKYGAIMLSWCKNATLDACLSAWRKALTGQVASIPELRPAGMINPAILPKPMLSLIVSAGKDVEGAWLILAAHKKLGNIIECDIPSEKMATFNEELKLFLVK